MQKNVGTVDRAIRALVERYQGRVYGLALRIVQYIEITTQLPLFFDQKYNGY